MAVEMEYRFIFDTCPYDDRYDRMSLHVEPLSPLDFFAIRCFALRFRKGESTQEWMRERLRGIAEERGAILSREYEG